MNIDKKYNSVSEFENSSSILSEPNQSQRYVTLLNRVQYLKVHNNNY
jgi:hypothetical protein